MGETRPLDLAQGLMGKQIRDIENELKAEDLEL